MDHQLTVMFINKDKHVSGKYGFTLTDEEGIEVFDSGFVYSSQPDATQAADDAILVAMSWIDDNYMNLGHGG